MLEASKAKDLKTEIDELAKKTRSAHDLMAAIVKLLHEQKYNWVGFYL